MLEKTYVSITSASCPDGVNFTEVQLERYPSSRATRLVDDPSRFLLVSVQKSAKDEELRRNMPSWVRDGVTIHGVRYRFLGFTESQVKAGKLMFLREDDEWNVPRLLSNFGDLPAVYIKSGYGKYSARLGLSFSSTVQSLDVPPELVLQVPDLVAEDGSLHSDGCGMIRDSFATEVCTRHGLPPDTTVFQIRRGGVKGLLVRYPDEKFDTLCQPHCAPGTPPVITYRPSMYKYDGGPTVLELNNHNAGPAAARLNFQFTALLLTLGVPLDVFRRLVQDQLDFIGAILTDRDKALAYIKGELDAAAEDSFVQGLYAMLLAGQDLSEPQVQSRLQAFQRKQYESLRKKMNLRIQDSGYLFGVVDEYGILGPDEVYINLPSRGGVLVRDVIVARNPAYHPGDVRKLRAVDHPELRHHRNCIVFSSTASHSVPDTIASGDLDGDTYFVTWDPTLLPEREAKPLTRGLSATATTQSPSTSRTRRVDDMSADAVETFIPLRYNKLLGMIANEWSRRVETTAELANAPHVVELVPMIESALDIMKSGEDLTMLESSFKRQQAQYRYSSQSFAGFVSPIQHLRDMIPQLDRESNLRLSEHQCDQALILRDEEPTRWNDYLLEARQVMRDFNRELSNAIKLDEQFGSEDGSQQRHDREEVPRHADRVKQDYQRRYFGGGRKKEQCEQRLRASAWYFYGYTQNKPAFSWIGERYLNEIKAWWSNGNRPPMFVGAAIPRPPVGLPSPLVRGDSEDTLVEQQQSSSTTWCHAVAMNVDSTLDTTQVDVKPLKATPTTDCHTRRRREADAVPSTIPRNRCAATAPLRVSVESYPKPRAPVVTACNLACSGGHEWILGANRTSRRYFCAKCGVTIHEKMRDGYWVHDKMTLSAPVSSDSPLAPRRSSVRTTDSPSPDVANVLSAISERDERESAGHDDDSDAMSIYESAAEDEPVSSPPPPLHRPLSPRPPPRRSSGGRSSLDTVHSDAPSSLFGLPPLRRLPARAGADVSTPIGRLRQVSSSSRRVSGNTPSVRTPSSPARSDLPSTSVSSSPSSPEGSFVLVAENPKPRIPVAGGYPSACHGSATHKWKFKHANGTHRQYTCTVCDYLAKEKKHGCPEIWVPA